MKRFNTEAIVLKNIAYKDAHRIYTLLTHDNGKITAVARGVRKISSRRSGSLDTLNHVSLNISEDKTGFYSIHEVKIVNSFKELKQSLDFILAGMYLSELVDVFLHPNNESPEVFKLLKSALSVLNKRPEKAERAVNVFELRLMEKLGFGVSGSDTRGEIGELLSLMKNQKDLAQIMEYDPSVAKKADIAIKDHLKRMVETYARYPRLNRFLSDSISR